MNTKRVVMRFGLLAVMSLGMVWPLTVAAQPPDGETFPSKVRATDVMGQELAILEQQVASRLEELGTITATYDPNNPQSVQALQAATAAYNQAVQNLEEFRQMLSLPREQAPSDNRSRGKALAQVEVLSRQEFEDGSVMEIYATGGFSYFLPDGEAWITGAVLVDENGQISFNGSTSEGFLVEVREDGFMIAISEEGQMVVGGLDEVVLCLYDEDGELVSITDEEGNEYDFEVGEDGSFTLTDPDGVSITVAEDGTYTIVDADGNLLEEGEIEDDFLGLDEDDLEADDSDDGEDDSDDGEDDSDDGEDDSSADDSSSGDDSGGGEG